MKKINKQILKVLIKNYVQNNSEEYETKVLNAITISTLKYPHNDTHNVSMVIRELVKDGLVEAEFNNTVSFDECIKIKITEKGKSYFTNRNKALLNSILIPIITSFFTTLITIFLESIIS